MTLIIIFLLSYLIGSIPFGLILVKLAGKGDIRKIGSGNIGATNVLRTGSKMLAALTLLLDGTKGFIAVVNGVSLLLIIGLDENNSGKMGRPTFIHHLQHSYDLTLFVAALGALLGHIFPVWLKFKGGKGVATALGIYFGLDWHIGAIACLTWLIVALLFRYSSLAALFALIAAFILPTIYFFAPDWQYRDSDMPNHAFDLMVTTFVIGVIVFLRHHANIRRLITHTEPKIGQTNATP